MFIKLTNNICVYLQLQDARLLLAVTTWQETLDRLYYLWVVQSHWVTCSKSDDPSTTPRNNIWCPVGTTGNMACFNHRRRHLGSWNWGVTVIVAVVKLIRANKGFRSQRSTVQQTLIMILFHKRVHTHTIFKAIILLFYLACFKANTKVF